MARAGLLLAGVGISALLTSGCELHGSMHGRSHHTRQDALAVVTEVERDGVAITLEVPPLVRGREADLFVRVRDTGSGQSVPDAMVRVAIRPVQALSGDHAGHVIAGAAGDRMDAAFDGRVHRVSHIPPAPGVYEVHATAERPGGESAAVVKATVHVQEGRGSVTPLSVLAVAGMAVMMVLKWVAF